jgi:hypothetical protein
MIIHLNLDDGVTLEVEFDYEQPTYAYFGDLEALTEPRALAKKVLFLGVDENGNSRKVNVLPLIKILGLYNELNLIIVHNMEAIDE